MAFFVVVVVFCFFFLLQCLLLGNYHFKWLGGFFGVLIGLRKRNSQCCKSKVLFVHWFSQPLSCLEKQLKCAILDNSMAEGMEPHC